MFDTFYDRRNGFMFYTNPLGALRRLRRHRRGQRRTPTGIRCGTSRTGRFEGGWTVEMAIPFKSLRYRSGTDQVWGIQLRRVDPPQERVDLPHAGAADHGRAARHHSRLGRRHARRPRSAAGEQEHRDQAVRDLARRRPIGCGAADLATTSIADVGVDVKYGVTANLTADFTVNTDFAQVEVDEQQVNLTRFSLFFPEKRDFFLEGRGIFDFGRGGAGAGGGDGGTTRQRHAVRCSTAGASA